MNLLHAFVEIYNKLKKGETKHYIRADMTVMSIELRSLQTRNIDRSAKKHGAATSDRSSLRIVYSEYDLPKERIAVHGYVDYNVSAGICSRVHQKHLRECLTVVVHRANWKNSQC
jgi:hypothetical protein